MYLALSALHCRLPARGGLAAWFPLNIIQQQVRSPGPQHCAADPEAKMNLPFLPSGASNLVIRPAHKSYTKGEDLEQILGKNKKEGSHIQ